VGNFTVCSLCFVGKFNQLVVVKLIYNEIATTPETINVQDGDGAADGSAANGWQEHFTKTAAT
jgi:hypothetical protein